MSNTPEAATSGPTITLPRIEGMSKRDHMLMEAIVQGLVPALDQMSATSRKNSETVTKVLAEMIAKTTRELRTDLQILSAECLVMTAIMQELAVSASPEVRERAARRVEQYVAAEEDEDVREIARGIAEKAVAGLRP